MSTKSGRDRSGSFSKDKSSKFKDNKEPRESRGDGTNQPKDRNYFLKYVQSVWHNQASELPALNSEEQLKDDNKILKLKEEAKALYEKLSEEYEAGTILSINWCCFYETGYHPNVIRRRTCSSS